MLRTISQLIFVEENRNITTEEIVNRCIVVDSIYDLLK